MQSVLGGRKPNLVVIDEVDGAVGGSEGRSAIAALLKIVNDGSSPASGRGEGGAGGGKPGKRSHLSRPIICVCNDPFVPALKPLREVAKMYMVNPPKVIAIEPLTCQPSPSHSPSSCLHPSPSPSLAHSLVTALAIIDVV